MRSRTGTSRSSRRAGRRRSPTRDGHLEPVCCPPAGWQRADVALARAYEPRHGPLLLVSGDGDFALLAARHPGPVLVVSEAPSARLRAAAPVVDPVHDGLDTLRGWLDTITSGPPG